MFGRKEAESWQENFCLDSLAPLFLKQICLLSQTVRVPQNSMCTPITLSLNLKSLKIKWKPKCSAETSVHLHPVHP